MTTEEAQAKAEGRSFHRPDGSWINYGLPSREQLQSRRQSETCAHQWERTGGGKHMKVKTCAKCGVRLIQHK